MTEEEKTWAIYFWQNEVPFHPLTCITSSHQELIGELKDGKAILVCIDCGYEQDYIPEPVLNAYRNREAIREMQRLNPNIYGRRKDKE